MAKQRASQTKHDAKDSVEDAIRRFSDRRWRLSNLYYILTKDGEVTKFQPNPAQLRLLDEMHHRTVILKARQLGYSTIVQLYILDACLFNSNLHAGIIAHDLESAEDIFTNKVKFAFERLPGALRAKLAPRQDTARQLRFANGSSITVGTSMRSGTLQMLHVSEMGKIAAKRPDKAREIVTGSFEAVPQSGIIWVESTAEGREGAFYDLVKRARDHELAKRPLQPLDWKFHFAAWHEEGEYRADPEGVPIYAPLQAYFRKLEDVHGILLDARQKAWYALKHRDLGDDMHREHPSHPDEAFEQSIEGAYYATQFQYLRKHDRICSVPLVPGSPVHTAWDLGMRDTTVIWFCQVIGREIRLIDYYETSGEGMAHYADVLREKEYRYGRHLAPHDIEVRELGTGRSRKETAAALGISFETIPRVPNEAEGIEAVRQFLPQCWFDEEFCGPGIKALEAYRKEWDERLGTYRNRPVHDWASHGAKAFETLARADLFQAVGGQAAPIKRVSAGGWT